MNKAEIEKLIGGYASGSLTDEERRQLFDAALDDQELFDALQGEQALKEVLDDPFSREEIRRAASENLPQARSAWFKRPWIWAAAASFATATIMLVALLQPGRNPSTPVQLTELRKQTVEVPLAPPPPQEIAPRQETAPQPAKPLTMPAPANRLLAKKKSEPIPPVSAVSTASESKQLAENDAVSPSIVPAAPQQERAQAAPSSQTFTAQQQSANHQQAFSPAPGAAATLDASQNQVGGALATRQAKAARDSVVPQLAIRAPRPFTFAKRMPDGSYVDVPSDAAFHVGDTLRLTIVSRASGPLVLSALNTKNPSLDRLFPAADQTQQVRANESYTVPVDIVVTPGLVLDLKIGALVQRIPISVR